MTQELAADKKRRKRKATYLVRREEKDALQDEIHALQQQLQVLQDRSDGRESRDQRRSLYASVGLNMALKQEVNQQQIEVASAQSLMSEWQQNQRTNPMKMRIHLGRDWEARRETLLSMKNERLKRGFHYVTARCRHLAPLKPQSTEERDPVPGVQCLKKVFEAVKFTIDTLEIAVSEQLGHITLRDDYDTVDTDAFISNYRLASTLECGVTTELNAVAFGQYVENHEGQPYAIMAIDSVDQDDLHPYHHQNRAQKMINGTVLLLPITRKKKAKKKVRKQDGDDDQTLKDEDETEVVIVMMRCFFSRMSPPECEISELAEQELRDNSVRWGDVVLQAIRRIIYAPVLTSKP